ncbi:leucyl/phenylalanyl-tRNA--protein transferase [Colwellia sp. 1_MG-2023]|uniref:leucyl/phenylalanyl-tRNA--protein transferase n=1 Tax=Colwellia sp. 1_MG-2023 TaxID=3062649 RepID=UPI0026E2C530|nr:leucyl/phenylalanyl-tRNA--protein transferase [Colwellia sp. 1_MG-2023]MDO6447005.1 leucyl/phenylalanyl-tRNA--protein transferase [Colwellia sp. 1_MG-2023]
MTQTIPFLSPDSLTFPPVHTALQEPNGLLAFGGDLTEKRLAKAYSLGIFPWFSEGEAIMWWSPDPRGVIYCNEIKINKTLKKQLKKQNVTVTLNHAFEEVIELCADAPFRKEGTWIVDEMVDAYINMHQHGLAHSIEVWSDTQLVGGLYGVAINGYFSGESMFYKQSNASKIALVYLVNLLKSENIKFLDCQMLNPFLADMGCYEISREAFIHQKAQALKKQLPSDFWQPRQLYLNHE